jgi:pimeloyl-ACP methyl ester carboxylesterase
MKFCEGKLPFRYGDETYETYYKVVGDLASGRTPLVIVHGGPAISHEYLVPCADLAASYSIPVIFYDQLGTASKSSLAII